MAMTREAKEAQIAQFQDMLSRSTAALVADFSGLNMEATSQIRRKFREAGVDYKVVKNTLIKRALKGTPQESLSEVFTHTTAVAFLYEDEYGKLGKTAKELAKTYDKFKVKAGFVGEDIMKEPSALDTMASLPTMEEARAQLLGVINAPASKLLAQINAPAQHVVGVLQARADKLEKGE